MTGPQAARGSGSSQLRPGPHQPKMMSGVDKFQQTVRKRNTIEERRKSLVKPKGTQLRFPPSPDAGAQDEGWPWTSRLPL
jgi:hypothetical protein